MPNPARVVSDTTRATDTRSQLLEAAIAVIEQGGEAAVRVRDIAAAAGVTYPSLYHFFGDRDGLIEAAQAERYRRGLHEALEPFRRAVEQCRTERDFHTALRDAARQIYSPERVAVRRTRINVLGSAQNRPQLAALLVEAQRAQNEDFAAILALGRDRGWVRDDVDLLMLAAWINGQSNGRMLIEMDLERADEAAWNEVSFDATVRVITGKPPLVPLSG
jgi:AcrR family transcriptional regulator